MQSTILDEKIEPERALGLLLGIAAPLWCSFTSGPLRPGKMARPLSRVGIVKAAWLLKLMSMLQPMSTPGTEPWLRSEKGRR